MTRISFAIDFEELIGILSTPVIPIEIRRMDLALVYRGVSTEPINLNQGSYFITANLPDGNRLFAYAEVTTHERTFVLLRDPDYEANELPTVELGSILKTPDAKLLFHYLENGYLREAVTLAKSKHFFESSHRDQSWFMLVLYTLLRTNELEILQDKLDYYRLEFSHDSPDIIAIEGEMLARLGRHEEAFETLLELESSGLPDFTDGVFYATQRLKIYRDVLPMESLDNEISAYAILRRLQRTTPHSQAIYDVLPLSIGLETLGGVFTKIFERNTSLPATRSEIFSTAEDNQTSVEMQVFQGERARAAENRLLGKFTLSGIAPQPRAVPQIEVVFNIDTRGVLTVTAIDLATGHNEKSLFSVVAGLSNEEARQIAVDKVTHQVYASGDEAVEATASELANAELEADAEG